MARPRLDDTQLTKLNSQPQAYRLSKLAANPVRLRLIVKRNRDLAQGSPTPGLTKHEDSIKLLTAGIFAP